MTADANQSKIYGDADPMLTYTFAGLASQDNSSIFSGELARAAGENVGTYAINQGSLSAGGNYSINFVPADFKILPATITGVTFNSGSFVYDGKEKAIRITGTLPVGTTVAYTNNLRTNAGTQHATATISGNNYHTLSLTATLTITPATRSITFPNLPDKIYGDVPFAAGATASSGEAILYSSSNPNVAAVSSEGQISVTGAGVVTITATLTENPNYSNNPVVSRTFNVAKAAQRITHSLPTEVIRDAGSIVLNATSTSRLPISYTLDDEQVATLNRNTLNIHRLGTVRITLTQEGNPNYEAAETIIVTVRVVDPSADFEVIVHPPVSPNGDGINDFLLIEGIRDFPDNKVTIFNVNGVIVYEVEGYNNTPKAFIGLNRNGQRLPEGTYFYIVELRRDGRWVYKKGYIVLKY